jgi:putative ABC transport system substrate-binding protein
MDAKFRKDYCSENRKSRIQNLKFVANVLAVLLAFIFQAEAQQQAKLYRVGVLTLNRLERPHIKALRDGLEKAGYIEGQNLILSMEQSKNIDDLRSTAKMFVKEKFDIIVANSNIETGIAQQETTEIPIVFMPASAPVRAGFVKSLAHPGTNLTGLTYYTDFRENGKQLEIFKEVVPSVRRVTILIDGGTLQPVDAPSLALVRKVAAHVGIKLTEKSVNSLLEAEQVVSSLSRHGTDGIHVTCTGLFSNLKKIGAISNQKKIPLYGCATAQVAEDGALFTYAPDMHQMGHRAAQYVDRILKGTRPQDLPVETPRKFEMVISLKTADAIGIRIPPEVLQRADKVIR